LKFIDFKDVVEKQVFTKTRGLVLAAGDGLYSQVTILPFSDKLKPKKQKDFEVFEGKEVGGLEGKISALSTRDDLIIAGSERGKVKAWSYNGTELFEFQLPELQDENGHPRITHISIRQDEFLVGRDEGYYVYPTCFPQQGSYTPLMSKKKKDGFCNWATYNIEGTNVKWHTQGNLNKFRPILPMYKSCYEVYVPSLYYPTKQIIIWTFSGKKVREINLADTDFHNIQFMWCDFQRLFWATNSEEIYTIDFSTGLEGDYLFEPAECFGLNISCQR
jgi:hypothetical protein